MQTKIIESQKIKIMDASTMDFTKLCEKAMRQALTVKKNQMLDKKPGQETVRELIQQQEMS